MGGVFQLVKTSAWTGAPYSATANGGFLQVSLSDTLLEWLVELTLLRPVPLHYLVPDPSLLPAESLRFVNLDPTLIGRLLDGAMAAAALGGGDLALGAAYRGGVFSRIARELAWRSQDPSRPRTPVAGVLSPAAAFAKAWDAAHPPRVDQPPFEGVIAGVLLRSDLVRHYPSLIVRAAAGGYPLGCLRCDRLAPSVLLALFHGAIAPDRIELQEPDEGTRFGVEPRDAGFGVDYRAPNGRRDGTTLPITLRPSSSPAESVLDLGALVAAIDAREVAPVDSTAIARTLQQAPFVQVIGTGSRPASWPL